MEGMTRRAVALDVVLALFITVMQVQGTFARVAGEGIARPGTSESPC
jgi:hypothetical protein